MWKNKWTEEGVSPVIATILMVAITVVLAAVLYVMVIGFTGPGNTPPKTTFSGGQGTGTPFQYQIDIAGVDVSKTLGDFKINLVRNGTVTTIASTTLITTVITATTEKGGQPMALTTLLYLDTNGDGKVSGGDRMILSNCQGGSSYEVTLFYKDLGKCGTGTFTTA